MSKKTSTDFSSRVFCPYTLVGCVYMIKNKNNVDELIERIKKKRIKNQPISFLFNFDYYNS